jgi:hypothetical protein
MPQHPKRPVSELKPAELRTIVGEIQKLLWLDEYATDEQRSNGGCTSFWNADKKWESSDIFSAVVTVLEDHGLKPIDPPTVIGFNSVDEFLEALPKAPPADEKVVEYDDVSDDPDPEHWTPHYRPPTS